MHTCRGETRRIECGVLRVRERVAVWLCGACFLCTLHWAPEGFNRIHPLLPSFRRSLPPSLPCDLPDLTSLLPLSIPVLCVCAVVL